MWSKTARRLAQKQPSFKKCVTAYSSRSQAPKMDGAKFATDTIDIRKDCDRQACWSSRTLSERKGGSYSNENPGRSRN